MSRLFPLALALSLALPSSSAAAGGDVGPPTAEQEELLLELAEQVRRFEEVLGEYRRDMSRVVELKYEENRDLIDGTYEGELDALTEEERQRRMDAIARFEAFLRKYPDHPLYTPDALFRLAELYFGKANDAYLQGLETYDDRIESFLAGKLAQRPEEPLQDYTKTIESFQSLIADFRDYRLIDGAHYLLGYCMTEMGEDAKGNDAFVALVAGTPDSQFAPEAWMRIGEYHFDYNDLQNAMAAYTKVLKYTESPYFDRALYKLAWTRYRNDDFDLAIQRFKQLIEYADAQSAEVGGNSTAGDLREEAVQYLAVSLSEEDWDGDALPDTEPIVDRAYRYIPGDKPYEVEVLRRLADIFFDNTRYEEGIAIYRYLLQRFPFHPDNPQVHMRIVESLERLRRIDEAFAERESINRSYDTESAWYQRNKNNREALKAADALTEQSLISAAVYHHDKAQQLKDKAKVMGDAAAFEESKRYYALAATNYEEYLRKYPHSNNAYELKFYYAECLYYSFRLLEAARQYASVREESEVGQYRHESAKAAILAMELHVDGEVEAGRLPAKASAGWDPNSEPPPEFPKDADGKAVITPEETPATVLAMNAERDRYVALGLNDPSDPTIQGKIAYKAAEIYYRFLDFEEARKRFWEILDKYRDDNDIAPYAASSIIETYRLVGNWEKMAEVGDKITALNVGSAEEQDKLKAEVKTLKVGALFKRAEQLFAEEKFEKAAQEYVKLVNEDPKNQYADRALNNAAVAYERLKKYESAMNLYERVYQEYPDREFAEYALYRTAVNSERFFNFEKATQLYLLLVDKFRTSDKRADALYTASLLQENNQQYEEAARNYERYVGLFPEREDAAETYYQAGLVYEKLGRTNDMFRIFNQFIRRYGGDAEHNLRVMRALDKMADARVKAGKSRDAAKLWKRIVSEFNRRGLEPASPSAMFAAKARFLLVDRGFRKFEKVRLEGSLKKQGKLLQTLIQRTVPQLKAEFTEIFDYKNLEWTLAAYFRQAQIGLSFADKLYTAPIPPAIAADPDAELEYQTQLEDLALPVEEAGVVDLEKTIEVARRSKITNEWTKKALEVLNKYKPQEYPLFKEEKRALKFETLSTGALLPAMATPGADQGEAGAGEDK